MIYDTAGNRLTAYSMSAEPGTQKIVTLAIQCESDYRLWAIAPTGVFVSARKLGDTAWVNLLTSDIPLTPYTPSRTTFQVRITAPTVIGRDEIDIKVTK